MTGKELMQKLRGSMTDLPGEYLIRSKRLAIGREILNEDPNCDALEIVKAYRNYGFTLDKAKGQSPEAIAALMERQEWIAITLAKVEQIYTDGEYHPDKLKAQAALPPEERTAPVEPVKAKAKPDAGEWQDVPEDKDDKKAEADRPGIDKPGFAPVVTSKEPAKILGKK